MMGQARLAGEERSRQILLDLAVEAGGLLSPWRDVQAQVTGRVRIDGWADDQAAAGTMRIAPVTARRIRYTIDFVTSDGPMRLDGWKSVSFARPLRSMTTLPVTITDRNGSITGEAQLRFDLWRGIGPMLASLRIHSDPLPPGALPGKAPASVPPARAYLSSRWRGQPGRLEVWYTTLTDPATGTGLWLHHELVAPNGGGRAYTHGWAAVFPPDGAPALARFGPQPWRAPGGGAVFASGGVVMTPTALRGSAGSGHNGRTQISWDLTGNASGTPLFTFPRWAWEREALPGAQIVPVPSALFHGTVRHGGRVIPLAGAPGATARVYGHGNAQLWAWLHADLGGGDVCEVVAATSTRPGLRNLPPLPLVRLRVGGRDWPRGDPILRSARFIARIRLPTWTVLGMAGGHRIRIQVTQPPERTVAVSYTDPDGSTAVCRNSERADAVIVLQRNTVQGWRTQRRWRLDATAHAEVGARE